ncbi:MAG TPA: hypothetical protein VIS73_07300 [Rhodocyclaceae bacterium]
MSASAMSTEMLDVLPRDVLPRLIETAQFNADLADAHFAQAATLCIYLLDMREYYRWLNALPLDAKLPREHLGPWIAEQEALWDTLRADGQEQREYRPLDPAVSGDPFDTRSVHELLVSGGLVYGAGIGRFGRPLFFLAECLRRETREGIDIAVCGRELARGSSAPPAMSRDAQVIVRRDALERWLWTRYEEWRHHPRENGFVAAWLLHSGGVAPGDHPDPKAIVGRIADAEIETLILHEIGERRIDALVGDVWHDMIDDLGNRKLEVFARSARDLLADCGHTLPTLLERGDMASLHCWFGLLDGMRLKFSPTLVAAYRATGGKPDAALGRVLAEAAEHWQGVCTQLVDHWQGGGSAAVQALFDSGAVGH